MNLTPRPTKRPSHIVVPHPYGIQVVLCGLLIMAACSTQQTEPHFRVNASLDESGEYVDVKVESDLPDSDFVEVSVWRDYTLIYDFYFLEQDTIRSVHAHFNGTLPVGLWRIGQRIELDGYSWLYLNDGPLDDPPSYRKLYSISDSIEVWATRPETHGLQNARSLQYLYAEDDTVLVSVVDWWP